jgi:hypothetical protein
MSILLPPFERLLDATADAIVLFEGRYCFTCGVDEQLSSIGIIFASDAPTCEWARVATMNVVRGVVDSVRGDDSSAPHEVWRGT